jgi:hypothetical protein
MPNNTGSSMGITVQLAPVGVSGCVSKVKKQQLQSLLTSVGSDRIDKRTIDNRANLSIIDNRLLIMIIIELGGEGPGRIYPSYSLF